MGALQSSPGEPEYVHLAKRTGFSFQQIGILHRRFKQLSHNEDTLLREHFRKIPDLESNPIRSQIIEAFFDRRNFRQNGEGTVEAIGFEEFLVIMSHFRPPSPHITEEQREAVRRDKLRCSVFRPAPYTCSPLRRPRPAAVGLIRFFFLLYPPAVLFNMHDTDNDGTITLEEYRHVSPARVLPPLALSCFEAHRRRRFCIRGSPLTSPSLQPLQAPGGFGSHQQPCCFVSTCPGCGGAAVSQRGAGEGHSQKHSGCSYAGSGEYLNGSHGARRVLRGNHVRAFPQVAEWF
ncbi:tescalcin b isoform 1-T1 [Spinachia spinachia]